MFPYTTFFFYTVPLFLSFIMPREAATGQGQAWTDDYVEAQSAPAGLRPSRSSATLARIKYGDGWEVKKGSRAGRFSLGFSGSVSPEKLHRDSWCTDFALIQEMLLSEHL